MNQVKHNGRTFLHHHNCSAPNLKYDNVGTHDWLDATSFTRRETRGLHHVQADLNNGEDLCVCSHMKLSNFDLEVSHTLMSELGVWEQSFVEKLTFVPLSSDTEIFKSVTRGPRQPGWGVGEAAPSIRHQVNANRVANYLLVGHESHSSF